MDLKEVQQGQSMKGACLRKRTKGQGCMVKRNNAFARVQKVGNVNHKQV